MANNVYYEDVEVGLRLPEWQRKTDFMHWNRYAAINDEFVQVHMDDEAGKAAGQGAAFGMGNLRWAYVINAMQEWAGDEAEIRELSMQFRAINHKNDVLTTQAVVSEKKIEDGEHRIYIDINVVNQDNVAGAPGKAVVVVPSRS